MSVHRYSRESLLFDGLRAAFGIACTLGPLVFLDLSWPITLILTGLGAVFSFFALKVAEQGLCPIELSAEGIASSGPVVRRLTWDSMTTLKLACYATPRRPSDGWYQLTLSGHGPSLKVDSTIGGFEDIVAAAVKAAEVGRITLDPTTEENLKSLGHRSVQRG